MPACKETGVRAGRAGKLCVASGLACFTFLVTSTVTSAPGPGALDPSFGVGGKVTTQIGPANDTADGVAVQRDGRILVAGSSFSGTDYDFAVVRYRKDGSLDPTFGRGGIVTTDIESTDDEVRAIAVQADGKIVVAGYAAERGYSGGYVEPDEESAWAIVRYRRNGSLDPSFGIDGKVATNLRRWLNGAYGVALQRNGKIVVSGFSSNGVDLDFALARYNIDGSPDARFGRGGFVTTAIGRRDEIANGLILQRDGKIVVAGPSISSDNYEVALARYLQNGSLDRTFGEGGVAWATNGAQSAEALAISLQRDGKLVAAGWSHDGMDFDFGVVRFLPNGSLDNRFGRRGRVTTRIGAGEDMGVAVAIQRKGRIVVAGHSSNRSDWDFALVGYLPNGSLDPAFGYHGKITTDFSGGDAARAVTVQADGKVVAAGYASNGRVFALARYLASPTRP
jgi:uncharacterized delta-60 repeat protein